MTADGEVTECRMYGYRPFEDVQGQCVDIAPGVTRTGVEPGLEVGGDFGEPGLIEQAVVLLVQQVAKTLRGDD